MHWSIFTCDNNNAPWSQDDAITTSKRSQTRWQLIKILTPQKRQRSKALLFVWKDFFSLFRGQFQEKGSVFQEVADAIFVYDTTPRFIFLRENIFFCLSFLGWGSNCAPKCHIPRWYDDAVFLRPRNFMFPVDVFPPFFAPLESLPSN